MTGSIEKRGKNSYRLVVFKGYDLDGRPIRHQKTIHCKKKSEAQIELAKFLTEVESGLIVDGNIPTFAQYVEIWTKDYALKELAPSTYYRYKRMLETRITPYFGHYKLNKIKPTDIMRFYDLLEEYKLWYDEQKMIVGDFWHESNRLFVQDDGKPIHPSTISKWFEKFVKKIGLPVINFHGLRHTNATLLISQQVDVATVSARLGHAQITTTYNFYVHPLKSHDRTAGNVLENLLISSKEN